MPLTCLTRCCLNAPIGMFLIAIYASVYTLPSLFVAVLVSSLATKKPSWTIYHVCSQSPYFSMRLASIKAISTLSYLDAVSWSNWDLHFSQIFYVFRQVYLFTFIDVLEVLVAPDEGRLTSYQILGTYPRVLS